jgi:hypothetical protein
VLDLLGCAMPGDLGGWLPGEEHPPVVQLLEAPEGGPPATQKVIALSGEEGFVPLTWQPVLTGNRIGTLEGRFATSFVDRGERREEIGRPRLADGTLYSYRVRSFDSHGALGQPSEAAQATTAGGPDAPKGLQAFSHEPRAVALRWTAAADPKVAGYEVFRSSIYEVSRCPPEESGTYQSLAGIGGRFRTHYVDEGLGDLDVFCYRVASRSAGGSVGEASAAVMALTKAEPLPPAGLCAAAMQLTLNRVAWEPNVEPDLEGYRLLRFRRGSPAGEVVDTVSPEACTPPDGGESPPPPEAPPCPAACSIEDRDVSPGEPISYVAVAFDTDGLESAPSEPADVVSTGYDLDATVREGAVYLSWDPDAARAFEAARVFRLGLFRRQELARVEATSYLDADVAPGHRYRYVVVLEREDGTLLPASAPVEIEVPEAGPNVATPPSPVEGADAPR